MIAGCGSTPTAAGRTIRARAPSVRESWDDPEQYAKVQFRGTIANDVAAETDLPICHGVEVEVYVPDPDGLPSVRASADQRLATLLGKEWPKSDFEAYAVARGFL